eukprot:5653537-Pyramimonas_sp.AAC.1
MDVFRISIDLLRDPTDVRKNPHGFSTGPDGCPRAVLYMSEESIWISLRIHMACWWNPTDVLKISIRCTKDSHGYTQ